MTAYDPSYQPADLAGQIAEMRAEMDTRIAAEMAAEDARSIRRNDNRMMVLVVGIACSLAWPAVMALTTHSAMMASFGAAFAFLVQAGVVAYAWRRRY